MQRLAGFGLELGWCLMALPGCKKYSPCVMPNVSGCLLCCVMWMGEKQEKERENWEKGHGTKTIPQKSYFEWRVCCPELLFSIIPSASPGHEDVPTSTTTTSKWYVNILSSRYKVGAMVMVIFFLILWAASRAWGWVLKHDPKEVWRKKVGVSPGRSKTSILTQKDVKTHIPGIGWWVQCTVQASWTRSGHTSSWHSSTRRVGSHTRHPSPGTATCQAQSHRKILK